MGANTRTTPRPARFTESEDEGSSEESLIGFPIDPPAGSPAGFPTESPTDYLSSESSSETSREVSPVASPATSPKRSAEKHTSEVIATTTQTNNGKLHKFSLKNVILILCY